MFMFNSDMLSGKTFKRFDGIIIAFLSRIHVIPCLRGVSMKIRLSWLREFLTLNESLSDIEDVLTMLGFPVEEIIPWGSDYVLDLELTVNRGDCLSHLGIARELSAYFGRPLVYEYKTPQRSPEHITSYIREVRIDAPQHCGRYVGLVIHGVEVNDSPEWLTDRLESLGVNTVNNIVDITNYIMFALGQPLHAFDLDKIHGKRIIVRFARNGEKLLALDGNEYELTDEDLVIADDEKPIALAGIIGGEETSIGPETKNIFLESAWFHPVTIRKTRRRLRIQTDSSYRFERHTDIENVMRSALMAAHHMCVIGRGECADGEFDIYPKKFVPRTIELRHERITSFLGFAIDPNWIKQRLKKLGFHLENRSTVKGKYIWTVRVPSYRIHDVIEETDLIEEIARHYDYTKIPSTLPQFTRNTVKDYDGRALENYFRSLLPASGWYEHISTSFYPEDLIRDFVISTPVEIANPLADNRSYLRPNVLIGLVECAMWNHRRKLENFRIWEIARVFESSLEQGHSEEKHIGFIMSGYTRPDSALNREKRELNFLDMKGFILDFLSLGGWEPPIFEKSDYPFLHPYQQVDIYLHDQHVGFLGMLHPRLEEKYEMTKPLFCAELNFNALVQLPRKSLKYKPYSELMPIYRDLSFLLDASLPFERVEAVLERIDAPELHTWWLIDIFRGKGIPEGKISYTIRFVFYPKSVRTSEEIDERMQYILGELEHHLSATLRSSL